MSPMSTRAQHKARQKRSQEARTLRSRGYVPIEVPPILIYDAQALGAKWDPAERCWLVKSKKAPAQLKAIEAVAPDGETHSVITGDCPWCGRTGCFQIHNYRALGSAEWQEGEITRCDFCFAITSHSLFKPVPRIEGEAPEQFLARCAAAIKERQRGDTEAFAGLD